MKKLGENLSKILDIEDVESNQLLPQVAPKKELVVADDVDADTEFPEII